MSTDKGTISGPEVVYDYPDGLQLQEYRPKNDGDIKLKECPAYEKPPGIELEECPAYVEREDTKLEEVDYEYPDSLQLQEYIPKNDEDIKLKECPAYEKPPDIKLEEYPAYVEREDTKPEECPAKKKDQDIKLDDCPAYVMAIVNSDKI